MLATAAVAALAALAIGDVRRLSVAPAPVAARA